MLPGVVVYGEDYFLISYPWFFLSEKVSGFQVIWRELD